LIIVDTSAVIAALSPKQRRYEACARAPFDREDLNGAMAIIENYRDLPLGLADASIVVLATRYDTRDVLTLDERHSCFGSFPRTGSRINL